MKKNYLLILFLTVFFQINAQDAYSNLVKVNRNVTAGAKSFNIENLKYHAKISKASINEAKQQLENTDCEVALDLSETISIHLESALLAKDFATAKAHLITSEDLVLKIFNEYNLCSVKTIENNSSGLSELEDEQTKLRQQQAELEAKRKEIKLQLDEQKMKQNLKLKENFINLNKEAIASNIATYNASLKACDCNVIMNNEKNSIQDLSAMSLEQLRTFFLDKTIKTAESYMSILKACMSR